MAPILCSFAEFLDPKSLVAQIVKKLPPNWETLVQSLGQEDPLEKGMAIYSRILAWRIPWTEEPGRLQSMGLQRVRHGWATNTHTHTVINSSMKALGRQRFKQGTKTWYEFPWWLSDKRICLPVQETRIQSLSQEDPLKKETATHSSILAWEIPWTEKEFGRPHSMGSQSWTWLSD